MRALLILAAFMLAGCGESDPGDATPDSQEWNIQGVQCEEYPWGDMAGGDVEKAGLEERLEAYYGFEFEKVKTGNDGKMYAAVCGGASGQHVQATVAGNAEKMRADGWGLGPMPSSAPS